MRGCVCVCVCVCQILKHTQSPYIWDQTYTKLCTHVPRLGVGVAHTRTPSHTRCKHALGCHIYYVLSIIKWAQCKCATHKLIFINGSNAKPNANATPTSDRDTELEDSDRDWNMRHGHDDMAGSSVECLFVFKVFIPAIESIEGQKGIITNK